MSINTVIFNANIDQIQPFFLKMFVLTFAAFFYSHSKKSQ